MKIDASTILQKVKKPQKVKVSLYIDSGLYEQFKKCCKDINPSAVTEELFRQFIESAKSKK